MRLSWPGGLFVRFTAHFWPLMAWTGFWAFILCGLLPSRAGPYLIVGFSLFGSLLCSFRKLASIPAMPLYYSYCGVIWPVLAGPLLDLLQAFLSLDYSDQHCHWVCIHATWASLTHSVAYRLPRSISSSLSILGSFSFIGHSWPIPILHSHGFLLTLWVSPAQLPYPLPLGFMSFPSTPYSLTSSLWACLGPFLLSYCPWVYYFFLWAPLCLLASFKTHSSFYGPMIHYSCHLGLMVFLSIY